MPRSPRNRPSLRHLLEELEPRQMLSLTHLYTFNDGSANDSIAAANATLYNGAFVSNGRLQLQNAGITSGGAVQYARLAGTLFPATGSATVYAWYYTDSSSPSAMRVFDFGNTSTGSYLAFTPKSSANDARAYFDTTTAAEIYAASAAGTTAAQGSRNFVAVTVDAAANTLSLYLNGALAGTASLAGANIGAITETLAYLGRSQFTADSGFSGSIDELRIYDEARTADQIAADNTAGPAFVAATNLPAKQAENLDRGIVALPYTSGGIYVGWRLLGTDPANITFNLYRSSNNGAFAKLNASPITASTNYIDSAANRAYVNKYYVVPVLNGFEQTPSETYTFTANFANSYLSIPLQIPAGGQLPNTAGTMTAYTYVANDCSVGDVDGDGQYEFIVKWDPTNSKDNSQAGYTGNVYVDAYEMNGTRLWRIDLGINIRAGAHYTQFQVYDFDGDGKAEVAIKTAPGTIDGAGHAVLMGSDSVTADYRNSSGYILTGPEYLTIFSGLTGAALATAAYTPDRGTLSNWGDTYGNRVDRYLAATAYLDGTRPSLIEARGYYTGSSGARNEITAWNYRNGQLTRLWWFKADLSNNNNMNSNYTGQGAHAIEIADLDLDGKDEILYGACAINDDGTPMWSTGLGHGDAIHVSDMDPARPGLEIFQVHEGAAQAYGGDFRNAITGQVYFGVAADSAGVDVGRGMAADIDPRYPGYEMWDSATATLFNAQGVAIGAKPSSQNFGIWWDADLGRELLDGTKIDDWNYAAGSLTRLLTGSGVTSNNSTKATPCLSGDILGDWREEVVWRASDNSELRIYSTTIPATNRIVTLMHDIQYREAIAWQNSAYNQPPNPSFFLGYNMAAAPIPNIYYPGKTDRTTTAAYQAETALVSGPTIEANWAGFNGTGFCNFPTTGGSVQWNNVYGGAGGLTTIRFGYALGNATSRTGRLTVNGIAQEITFTSTGTWDGWTNLALAVTLNAGTANTILMESTGQDLGNIDELQVDAIVPPTVVTRALFYNNSAFDGYNAAANTADDGAIATDKSPLLPGNVAAFANLSSCFKGINGIMLDIADADRDLTAADFQFSMGNNNTPDTWAAAPAPLFIVNRAGAGVNGATRVEVIFADNAIVNRWLRVTLKGGASATTGLLAEDVFYFGSAMGETGSDPACARVDATDVLVIRAAATATAAITNSCDLNRDGRVNSVDEILARANVSWFLNEVQLITAPAAAGASLAAGSAVAAEIATAGVASVPAAPAVAAPAAQVLVSPTVLLDFAAITPTTPITVIPPSLPRLIEIEPLLAPRMTPPPQRAANGTVRTGGKFSGARRQSHAKNSLTLPLSLFGKSPADL